MWQCVAAAPAVYDFSALVRQDPDGATVDATGFCFYFGTDDCMGAITASGFVPATLNGTGGTFVGLQGGMTAPSGARSALCGVDFASDGEPFFEVVVDRVTLVETPVFEDGFESGDTSAWSLTFD